MDEGEEDRARRVLVVVWQQPASFLSAHYFDVAPLRQSFLFFFCHGHEAGSLHLEEKRGHSLLVVSCIQVRDDGCMMWDLLRGEAAVI